MRTANLRFDKSPTELQNVQGSDTTGDAKKYQSQYQNISA